MAYNLRQQQKRNMAEESESEAENGKRNVILLNKIWLKVVSNVMLHILFYLLDFQANPSASKTFYEPKRKKRKKKVQEEPVTSSPGKESGTSKASSHAPKGKKKKKNDFSAAEFEEQSEHLDESEIGGEGTFFAIYFYIFHIKIVILLVTDI